MKILIVDTSALMHRAYHAYPLTLTTKDGRVINALFGFVNILLDVIGLVEPDKLFFALDLGGKLNRHDLAEDYKGNRGELDLDLLNQIELIHEFLNNIGFPGVGIKGYEADDIIGTLSEKYSKDEVVIVTQDADQYQLVVNNNIKILSTSSGKYKFENRESLTTKLGFDPEHIVTFKALAGDAGDNISGVKGIGKITAAKLVAQYKTLDSIYTHIRDILPKSVATKLEQGRAEAVLSEKLAQIVTDAPIFCDDEMYSFGKLSFLNKVALESEKYSFRSVITKLQKMGWKHQEVGKQQMLHTTFPESINLSDNVVGLVGVNHSSEKLPGVTYFDFTIANFLISSGESKLVTASELLSYNGVTDLNDLYELQNSKLVELGLSDLFYNVEVPLAFILRKMETRGVVASRNLLESERIKLMAEKSSLATNISEIMGYSLNIDSPKQLGNVLVEKFGLVLPKNKNGFSTAESELLRYRSSVPVIDLLLSYREVSKLLSTYIDGLISAIGLDGRIHTTYNQLQAVTGRLSSINPNLQNLPTNSDSGLRIKSALMGGLVRLDYSQQELRLLAHLASEEQMIEAFKQGRDIHKVTASQLFSVPYDLVDSSQRNYAKTVNFGIIYGMGAFGMSERLGIPVHESQKFIDKFFENFPNISKYYDSLIADSAARGYATTILGRRKNTAGLNVHNKFARSQAVRETMNFPIQGSAADMIKRAMVGIADHLSGLDGVHMVLQIHDELAFEFMDSVTASQKNKVMMDLKNIMENALPLALPVVVDIKDPFGTNGIINK